MSHGDKKRITVDDGCAYDVEAVHIPGAITTYSIVVNAAMRDKATQLLPFALAMEKVRAARASFYRTSERSLGACGGLAFVQAEEAMREARERVEVLSLVANGLSLDDKRSVTVDLWREVLFFFHQSPSVGAVLTAKE